MAEKKPIAVIDANVLYSASLRDVLLSLADYRLYEFKWTEEICAEWKRNVLANRQDITEEDFAYTRSRIERAFIDGFVEDYEDKIDSLSLPDLKDRHVLAAAIEIGANYIITKNLKDFPPNLLATNKITPINPDDFVLELCKENIDGVTEALKIQRARLRKPPMTQEEFLLSMANNDLPKSSDLLKPHKDKL